MSRSISGVAAAVVALVGLSCSAGDSGVAVPSSSSSADVSTPSSSVDERAVEGSAPVSSDTSSLTIIPADALHRAPDAITREGAMLAGVDVLNGGGVVVSGTATSVHVERGEFDMDHAVTTIDVGRTFLGPELDEIEVYTAVPFFQMVEGRSYLLFVNPTTGVPGRFTPVGTYLFEPGENGWVALNHPAPHESAPLVLRDAEVVDLIEESRVYMVDLDLDAPSAG